MLAFTVNITDSVRFSTQNQQEIRIASKDDNPLPFAERDQNSSSARVQPRLALVVSINEKKGKDVKGNKNSKKDLREKLMQTLLENGEVKNVNSLGLTSDEDREKKHLDNKHDELWALLEAMVTRKKQLQHEIKKSNRDRQDDVGEENIINDYHDQKDYIGGDDLSEPDRSVSAGVVDPDDNTRGIQRKKKERKTNWQRNETNESDEVISSIEKLPSSLGKFLSPSTIRRLGLLDSSSQIEDFGSEQGEISQENWKTRDNADIIDSYNVNVKFSKFIGDKMKDLHVFENSSRKKKKTKRNSEDDVKEILPTNIDGLGEQQTAQDQSMKNQSKIIESHQSNFTDSEVDRFFTQESPNNLRVNFKKEAKKFYKKSKEKQSNAWDINNEKYAVKKNVSKEVYSKKKDDNGIKKSKKIGETGEFVTNGTKKKERPKKKEGKFYYIDLNSLSEKNSHEDKIIRSKSLQKKKGRKFTRKFSKNQQTKDAGCNRFSNHGGAFSSNFLNEDGSRSLFSKEMSALDSKMTNLESRMEHSRLEEKDTLLKHLHTKNQKYGIKLTKNESKSQTFESLRAPAKQNVIEKLGKYSVVESSTKNSTTPTKQSSPQSNSNHALVQRKPRSLRPSKHRHVYNADSEEYNDYSSAEADFSHRSNFKSSRSIPFNWYDFNRYMRTSDDYDYNRIPSLLKKYFEDQQSNEESVEDYAPNTPKYSKAQEEEAPDQEIQPSYQTEDKFSPKSARYEKPPLPEDIAPVEPPLSSSGIGRAKIADEYNEARENSNAAPKVPEDQPTIEPRHSEQQDPEKKDERSLLLKRKNGLRIPLRLVQDEDGNLSVQLDMRYICRKCTKQRQKRKRQQAADSH